MRNSYPQKGAIMITLTREEAQQVLDALEAALSDDQPYIVSCKQTVETLRARLAQPEPKPIAYLCENAVGHKYFRWKKPQSIFKPIALYTAPPQREWVGLTHEEKMEILTRSITAPSRIDVAEAMLKEKNT
jgi:hypothetical protein